jgi:hypothetical protein
MKVLYITHFKPSDIGHGGNHRSYQIMSDLKNIVGDGNVEIMCFPDIRKDVNIGVMNKIKLSIRNKCRKYTDNPYKLINKTNYSTHQFSKPELLQKYKSIISKSNESIVCVLEHSGFGEIIRYNNGKGIPTIACLQNIESFDRNSIDFNKKYSPALITTDFANELKMLSLCDQRLFISKIETGIINGLNLPSLYYPYLPVGKIKDRLHKIGEERKKKKNKDNLFLMIGTAAHNTTFQSMKEFLIYASNDGLPSNTEIYVIGKQTDNLSQFVKNSKKIKFYGWVEQNEFDDLLIRSKAIIAPQFHGFGALTRIIELSCAHIPVLTSSHAAMAIDIPPGVIVLGRNWDDWYLAIEKISKDCCNEACDYESWESTQGRPIYSVVKKYLANDQTNE